MSAQSDVPVVIGSTEFPQLRDLLGSAVEEFDLAAGGLSPNIPTGFAELTDITGGFAPGSLTIVSAHPGVGGSALGLSFVRAVAVAHGIPAALVTLDSTPTVVTQRLICAESNISAIRLLRGHMTGRERTLITEAMDRMRDAPLTIVRPSSADASALFRDIERLVGQRGIRMVVIDPVDQLARDGIPHHTAPDPTLAARLKRLAVDTNTAVVVIDHLPIRPREQRYTRPMMADLLRAAPDLARAADYAILIDRPDASCRHDPRMGEADLLIVKNRFGPLDTITVAHQLHTSKFITMLRVDQSDV